MKYKINKIKKNHRIYNNNKEKKIRKILLISSDIEMQKKLKSKKYTLINSMTPKELENYFQLCKGPINTSISTYTNVLEKHIVKQIVDIPKNINYFYSDLVDNNKNDIKRRIFKYQTLYSAKDFIVNYDNLIDETKREEEKVNKEELLENLIPFASKKKSVGQEKISGSKSYPLLDIGQKKLFQIINEVKDIKKIYNNNEIQEKEKENSINSSFDSNPNSPKKNAKYDGIHKKRKKILDVNYKLIYYCYKYLKRKRPLPINSSFNAIYGFEIEETFFKNFKKNKTIKENKLQNKIGLLKLQKSKSSKEMIPQNQNSSKKKKKENANNNNKIKKMNSKEFLKRNRIKSVVHSQKTKKKNNILKKQKSNNNCKLNHNDELFNDSKIIKRLAKKLVSIRSEKKNEKNHKRLSQLLLVRRRANSIEKKEKNNKIPITNRTHHKRRIKRLKSSTQNLMSKDNTKNSSSDNDSLDNSSNFQNKKIKKNLFKIKEKDNGVNKQFEKLRSFKKEKDYLTMKKLQFINQSKIKNEYPEEDKVKEMMQNKKHRKTLVQPIKIKGFEINDDEKNNIKDNINIKYSIQRNNNSKKKTGKTTSLKNKKKSNILSNEFK